MWGGQWRRALGSLGSLGRSMSTNHAGFVELREYTLHPQGIKPFIDLTAENVDVRKQLLPFLG